MQEKIIQILQYPDDYRYIYCLTNFGAIYLYDQLNKRYELHSPGLPEQ